MQAARGRRGGSNTRPYHAHNIYGMNFTHLNSRVISPRKKQVRAGSEWGMGTLSWMERDGKISTRSKLMGIKPGRVAHPLG